MFKLSIIYLKIWIILIIKLSYNCFRYVEFFIKQIFYFIDFNTRKNIEY
jgi:hypothetical protein